MSQARPVFKLCALAQIFTVITSHYCLAQLLHRLLSRLEFRWSPFDPPAQVDLSVIQTRPR